MDGEFVRLNESHVANVGWFTNMNINVAQRCLIITFWSVEVAPQTQSYRHSYPDIIEFKH